MIREPQQFADHHSTTSDLDTTRDLGSLTTLVPESLQPAVAS
jgi:hypothetical protein